MLSSQLGEGKKKWWDPFNFFYFISLLLFFSLHLNTHSFYFPCKFLLSYFFPPKFYSSKHSNSSYQTNCPRFLVWPISSPKILSCLSFSASSCNSTIAIFFFYAFTLIHHFLVCTTFFFPVIIIWVSFKMWPLPPFTLFWKHKQWVWTSLGFHGEIIGGSSMKLCIVLPSVIWIWVILSGIAYCEKPGNVSVGAVFTFNSVIGRAAKTAMEMAVDDVNADPTILNGTKLSLAMEDAACSVWVGLIGGCKEYPCRTFIF